MNQDIESWSHGKPGGRVADDYDDDDGEEDIVFDDEEDEFGLPSIASMRKRQNRKADALKSKATEPPIARAESKSSTLGVGVPNNRLRANSSDIAEERDIPLYPTTVRKSEGKILRPQYKDILRGML